jgi:hypothetical protein
LVLACGEGGEPTTAAATDPGRRAGARERRGERAYNRGEDGYGVFGRDISFDIEPERIADPEVGHESGLRDIAGVVHLEAISPVGVVPLTKT